MPPESRPECIGEGRSRDPIEFLCSLLWFFHSESMNNAKKNLHTQMHNFKETGSCELCCWPPCIYECWRGTRNRKTQLRCPAILNFLVNVGAIQIVLDFLKYRWGSCLRGTTKLLLGLWEPNIQFFRCLTDILCVAESKSKKSHWSTLVAVSWGNDNGGDILHAWLILSIPSVGNYY